MEGQLEAGPPSSKKLSAILMGLQEEFTLSDRHMRTYIFHKPYNYLLVGAWQPGCGVLAAAFGLSSRKRRRFGTAAIKQSGGRGGEGAPTRTKRTLKPNLRSGTSYCCIVSDRARMLAKKPSKQGTPRGRAYMCQSRTSPKMVQIH